MLIDADFLVIGWERMVNVKLLCYKCGARFTVEELPPGNGVLRCPECGYRLDKVYVHAAISVKGK